MKTRIIEIMEKINNREQMAERIEKHVLELDRIDRVHNTSKTAAFLTQLVEEIQHHTDKNGITY